MTTPDSRSTCRTFLSLRGYEARCYTRGDELLASMKQAEAPDVVLLDVMMPGLDGMATLRALKASRPEAQVIMLSGRNQASTIVEAVRLGAADYVVKPDDPEGLGEIALDVAIKNAIEKNRLVSELSELRQQLSDDEDRAVWGNSEKMRGIATVIEQVADSDVGVLIRGESGVGKELVSRAIHQRSTRRNRPFVKVNCAALPAELLESELFGHERGAFTGAANTRIGKFEQADTGTLMLDEIGEMKPALQAKLLHVLQDGEFTKLGSNKRVQVDVRDRRRHEPRPREDDAERRLPRGPLLPVEGHRADGAAAARAAGRDSDPHRLLHRALRPEVQPAGAAADRAAAPAVHAVRMARQHPRAREHDQARRHPSGRAAGHPGDRAQHAARGRGARAGGGRGRRRGDGDAGRTTRRLRHAAAGVSAAPGRRRRRCRRCPMATSRPKTSRAGDSGGGSLAAVAKAASMKAERAAIEHTLRQVHWNRRKAAQILGVSYKTLLNKIKECGISRA